MKTLLAGSLLLVLSQVCRAESYIVMGDSIASCPTCWPSELRDFGNSVRELTQGARFTLGYSIPPDLKPIDADTVLYALGTNDGVALNSTGFAFAFVLNYYTEKFKIHMDTLKHKNFTIILIVPARYSAYADGMDVVRDMMFDHCAATGIQCIDAQLFWDESETLFIPGTSTPDTLHPNATLTAIMANEINAALP